jgi:hypothetical protein
MLPTLSTPADTQGSRLNVPRSIRQLDNMKGLRTVAYETAENDESMINQTFHEGGMLAEQLRVGKGMSLSVAGSSSGHGAA